MPLKFDQIDPYDAFERRFAMKLLHDFQFRYREFTYPQLHQIRKEKWISRLSIFVSEL